MRFVKDGQLATLSAANFFARYHYYLIGLVISTFLAGFMSEIALGWVIAGASLATAISMLIMPKIFNQSGTRRVLVIFGLVEMGIAIALTMAHSATTAAVLFTLQGICAYNMFLGLDLLLEAHTTDEKKTGHSRGLFLVLANLSVLAASISISYILNDHNYPDVFLIAAAAVVPFTLLAASFPSISKVEGSHTSFHHTLREMWRRTSLLPTISAHLLLLLFFTWDVYYLPLYLYEHIGFSWQVTGLLFGIGILPYVLAEYPLGMIADRYVGEKEIAFLGFIIMALGTVAFAYLSDASIAVWAMLILVANLGGAMVEVSTETHFFKHVQVTDADLVSVFRMLRPLAAIVAPAIASLCLIFVPFQDLFIVFGVVLLCGLPIVFAMTDTR